MTNNELSAEDIAGLQQLMAKKASKDSARRTPTPQTRSAGDEVNPDDIEYLKSRMDSRKLERLQRKAEEISSSTLKVKLDDEIQSFVADAPESDVDPSTVSLDVREGTDKMPHIPSAQEAKASGLVMPHLDDFRWVTGIMKISLPEDVVLPEEPSPLEMVAYSIVPAFVRQYGSRYRGKYGGKLPLKLIVRQWIQAMTPKDDDRGTNCVLPHELRLVVDTMASGNSGQDFNPRLMMGHALDWRLNEDAKAKKTYEQAVEDTYAKLSGHDYFFYRTVAPTPEFSPTDWVWQAQYPDNFLLPNIELSLLRILNNVLTYRFLTEDEFSPIMARWVATKMLIAMGCFTRDGNPLTPLQVLQLAYRFSIDYIREVHPHDESFYTTKPIPKFVPPTDCVSF